MNVFVCTDHDSHYPVGCASIIIAEDIEQARALLDKQLIRVGLNSYKDEPYTLIKMCLEVPTATILVDGNY